MARQVLGLVEKVVVYGKNKRMTLQSRIDTGATKASIDKNLAEKLGLVPRTETRIIKSAHGISKRQLVEIKIKLKNKTLTGEFTLADRSHMTYPVLIGQNILKQGEFLIDPLI